MTIFAIVMLDHNFMTPRIEYVSRDLEMKFILKYDVFTFPKPMTHVVRE